MNIGGLHSWVNGERERVVCEEHKISEWSLLIRRRRSKSDFCDYIYGEKSRYVFAKRSVSGLRR
jgi:hypothetical protein